MAGAASRGDPLAVANWPGEAFDRDTSRRATWPLLGLASREFFAACELGRRPRARAGTIAVMVGVTVALVVEGFFERAGLLHVYGRLRLAQEGLAFAGFNYHANAGTFVDLAFALACSRALAAGRGAASRPSPGLPPPSSVRPACWRPAREPAP